MIMVTALISQTSRSLNKPNLLFSFCAGELMDFVVVDFFLNEVYLDIFYGDSVKL